MAKSDKEKLMDRLQKIEELQKKKAEIEDQLMILIGIKQIQRQTNESKPDGFSLMESIRDILVENNTAMKIGDMVPVLKAKYGYAPDPSSIRSTAKYMVKKGLLLTNEQDKTFIAVNGI